MHACVLCKPEWCPLGCHTASLPAGKLTAADKAIMPAQKVQMLALPGLELIS